MFEGPALWAIGTALFTGGIAWGSVKHAINGTKEQVDIIAVDVKQNSHRLTKVEVKIDSIHEKLKNG